MGSGLWTLRAGSVNSLQLRELMSMCEKRTSVWRRFFRDSASPHDRFEPIVTDAATYANGSFDPKSFAEGPNDLCFAFRRREEKSLNTKALTNRSKLST